MTRHHRRRVSALVLLVGLHVGCQAPGPDLYEELRRDRAAFAEARRMQQTRRQQALPGFLPEARGGRGGQRPAPGQPADQRHVRAHA